MESTEPWGGRKVGPVAGVLVAVGGKAGLLTQAAGFSGWTEEGGKKADFGECWVGSGWIVGREGDAVFGVGADYGRLFGQLVLLFK